MKIAENEGFDIKIQQATIQEVGKTTYKIDFRQMFTYMQFEFGTPEDQFV